MDRLHERRAARHPPQLIFTRPPVMFTAGAVMLRTPEAVRFRFGVPEMVMPSGDILMAVLPETTCAVGGPVGGPRLITFAPERI